MGSDLQRALCCSGKLTSVSLFHVRELFRSCLNAIMNKNPQLQTLSLGFVEEFVEGKSSFLNCLELVWDEAHLNLL